MTRSRIIALIGIDGAGKSTSAQWLVGWLAERGVPASHFMNPGGRRWLGRLGQRLGRTDAVGLLGRRGFPVAEAIIRFAALLRALLICRLRGRVAVMDRYTYCQYAVMRARGDAGERLIRILYSLFPRPDLVCYLQVEPGAAHHRVLQRGTDEEEIEHLRALDAGYLSLPEFGRFRIVSAGAGPDVVQAQLAAAVAPLFRPPAQRRRRLTAIAPVFGGPGS